MDCPLPKFPLTLKLDICNYVSIYVTVFEKTYRLTRKTKFFFIALLPFTSSEDAAVLNIEVNPMLRLRVRQSSFFISVFVLK